jgi:hypothetical protein
LQAFSLFGCNPFLSPDKLCVELGLLVHKLFCHEFVAGDHKNNTTRERAPTRKLNIMQSAGVIIHDFILHSPMLQRMLHYCVVNCGHARWRVPPDRREKFLERANRSHHAAA